MCSTASFCASPSAFAGVGVPEFVKRLDQRALNSNASGSAVQVKVMGNSVARWHGFLALRTFARMLGEAWPGVRFTLQQTFEDTHKRLSRGEEPADPLSIGGYSHEHTLHCNLVHLHDADVILVLYAEASRSQNVTRDLYLHLLALPRTPLVIVIQHCTLAMFEMLLRQHTGLHAIDSSNISAVGLMAAAQRDKHLALGGEVFLTQLGANLRESARQWELDSAVLDALRIPRVDMCALLRTVHTWPKSRVPKCASSTSFGSDRHTRPAPASSFDVLTSGRAFRKDAAGLGDTIHPTSEQCAACPRYLPLMHAWPNYDRGQPCAVCMHATTARTVSVCCAPSRAPACICATMTCLRAPCACDARSAFLQGCAAAQIVMHTQRGIPLQTTRPPKRARPGSRQHRPPTSEARLTAPAYASHQRLGSSWCITAFEPKVWGASLASADERQRRGSTVGGWRLETGGRGGYKRWWQPLRDGARMHMLVPATRPRLLVEYYQHDDAPMGSAAVSVSIVSRERGGQDGLMDVPLMPGWTLCGSQDTCNVSTSGQLTKLAQLDHSVRLDTRCKTCQPHRGFMHIAEVIRGLRLNANVTSHRQLFLLVTLTAMAQGPAIDRHTNFSLAAVIGAD